MEPAPTIPTSRSPTLSSSRSDVIAKRRIYSQLLFDLTCDLMLSETIRYDTRVFGNYRTGFSLRNDLSLSSLCEIPFSDHSSIWADHFSAQLSDGLDTRLSIEVKMNGHVLAPAVTKPSDRAWWKSAAVYQSKQSLLIIMLFAHHHFLIVYPVCRAARSSDNRADTPRHRSAIMLQTVTAPYRASSPRFLTSTHWAWISSGSLLYTSRLKPIWDTTSRTTEMSTRGMGRLRTGNRYWMPSMRRE